MSRRDEQTGTTWRETVADEPLPGSGGVVGDLRLDPVDPAVVQRVLARLPPLERDQDFALVLPVRSAVLAELDPELAAEHEELHAEFAREEARLEQAWAARPGVTGTSTAPGATTGDTATPAGTTPPRRTGVVSGAVLGLLMLTAWLPTLGSMRQGFDGVVWTWVVAVSLLVSLACAVGLATPRLMTRPVATDWGRGTGFGLVAIAAVVLLGSVLLRLYNGSIISTETLPQFVVLVAVAAVSGLGWLLLRDRTSRSQRTEAAMAALAAGTTQVEIMEEQEEMLTADLERLGARVPAPDARRALAVELASLQQLFEADRLGPVVAREAAGEAARFWRTGL